MKSILHDIKNRTSYFFILYFTFLIGLVFILLLFDKKEGTIWINQTWTPLQDSFFSLITHIGDGITAVLILVFILLFVSIKKAGMALASFVFTASVTQFLKHIVFSEAMRPFIELHSEFRSNQLHLVLAEEAMKKGNSFPSGHTTSAFSIFLILTLISNRPKLGVLFGLLAILASYSRVYLGQHFFEDIFLGSIIGVAGTLFIYVLFRKKNLLSSFDYPLLKNK